MNNQKQRQKQKQPKKQKQRPARRKRNAPRQNQLVLNSLNPFLSPPGSKIYDSYSGDSVAYRGRFAFTLTTNNISGKAALFVAPRVANIIANAPLTSNQWPAVDTSGTKYDLASYNSIITSFNTFRIVNFAVRITPTSPNLNIGGQFSIYSFSDVLDAAPITGFDPSDYASKEHDTYPSIHGQSVTWLGKPLDNGAAEYVSITSGASAAILNNSTRWSTAIIAFEAQPSATFSIEVLTDLELLPSVADFTQSLATPAGADLPSVQKDISNIRRGMADSFMSGANTAFSSIANQVSYNAGGFVTSAGLGGAAFLGGSAVRSGMRYLRN